MSRPLLGAHVSAAGGLYKSIERGEELGAETIQIFGASPRQWKASLPSDEDVKRYKDALEKSSIKSVYLHAAYLVNLATGKKDLFKKSVDNLAVHFEIANLIGAQGLIFHIGSNKEDKDKALQSIIYGMRQVLSRANGSAKLIMENSSGGGGKIGSDIDEMAKLFKGVSSKRVGLCIDTAHAFEAGVLRYDKASIKSFFDEWDKKIGVGNLVALHLNDSKTEFGSNSDRHENLGEGEIGLSGLRALAKEKRLKDTDWILEVPGFDGGGPDKKNLKIMEGLFG